MNAKVLSPALRAYLFVHLYITVPKIFFNVLQLARKDQVLLIPCSAFNTLRKACRPTKFPALAAKLMLQINATEPLVYYVFKRLGYPLAPRRRLFVSTVVAVFCAALIHFKNFQNTSSAHGRQLLLDLTLLVAVRAADTAAASTLSYVGGGWWALVGDGALFVATSALIMYSWFYYPERLPTAYRNWITSAASMDDELVELLREVKHKRIAYGEKGRGEHLLQEFCERKNQSPERGSLLINQPLSCECVHAFVTPNCELHALYRFARGVCFAMKLYGSINLLMLVLRWNKPRFWRNALQALANAARSSCFLASFIALCWYGVCLGRTRLLPALFPHVPRTRWDDTVAVACGCVLCGFSCFVETPQRRKELALFVAPRAFSTLVSTE
ncbi:hypothetical protein METBISCDRAFT_20226, partial [Metschnikowia bicuspidata]